MRWLKSRHFILATTIGILLASAVVVAIGIVPAGSGTPRPSVSASDARHVTYTGTKGMTVLAELKQLTQIDTQSSTYGTYVTAINNVRAGTGGEYWNYYVNGKLATVGADSYVLKGGEAVEWKFEK